MFKYIRSLKAKHVLNALFLGMAYLLLSCNNYRAINEENEHFKKAEEYQKDQKIDQAIEAYKECLRLSPDSYKAHYKLGMIYSDIKSDYPRAIVHFQDYLNFPEAELKQQVRELRANAEERYYRILNEDFKQPTPIDVADLDTPKPDTDIKLPKPPETDVQITPLPPKQPEKKDPPKNKEIEKPAEQIIHTVASGENLMKISEKYFGDRKYYYQIYLKNKATLKSPNSIKVGQKLYIPVVKKNKVGQ